MSEQKKTIFITMADPMTVRNIFRTPFWRAFLSAHANTRIVVLTVPDKREYYEKTFGAPNVLFEALRPQWAGWYANLLASIAHSSAKTGTNRWSKMRTYQRGESTLFLVLAKRFCTWCFGGSPGFKKMLRSLILRIAPAADTAVVFEKYKPSLVIGTYIASFAFDVPVACEAKRRGVRVVGITRSWDTLSSHGMLRVVPDVLVVQSQFLRQAALRYQAIEEKITPIHVVGLPHYDAYRHVDRLLETREAFLSRMGLDAKKKVVLYAAMGDFLFANEGGIAEVFEQLVESGAFVAPVQLLYRAHPRFPSPLEKMKTLHHVIPDRGATYLNDSLVAFEMEAADERHLINSLYHADVVVTAGSTCIMDAAAFDKPTVCVAFDGTATHVPYWLSVQRFYDSYTHVEAAVATGGVRLARTPEALAAEVNRYLNNPTCERSERAALTEAFAGPFDGHASERLEKILTKEVTQCV
jgi:hypothetical protein